jgi:hypothetical protein
MWKDREVVHRECRGRVGVSEKGGKCAFFCGFCGERSVRHACGKLCGNRKYSGVENIYSAFFTGCRKRFAQFEFSLRRKDFLHFSVLFFYVFPHLFFGKMYVVVGLWKTV